MSVAASIGILEAIVPVGAGLEEEHDALVGEAELRISASLPTCFDQRLGVVEVDVFLLGEGVIAELLEEDRDVGFLEDYLAHRDERRASRLGVFDEVLPAIGRLSSSKRTVGTSSVT